MRGAGRQEGRQAREHADFFITKNVNQQPTHCNAHIVQQGRRQRAKYACRLVLVGRHTPSVGAG